MTRLFLLSLLVMFAPLSAAESQSDSPPAHILHAARTALSLPHAALPWTREILSDVTTTALGCELLPGVPLPDAIEVHRLRFGLDGQENLAHVSADGGMFQVCADNAGGILNLHFPAFRDSDGDGVGDENDACPAIAGVETDAKPGCPLIQDHDSDGDGVGDDIDFCPIQAGSAALDGCALLQDSDGDGAPDTVDICPRQTGSIREDFALGCPADGSGSSVHSRGADDLCFVAPLHGALRESPSLEAAVIDSPQDSAPQFVIGRDSQGHWLRLESGWALTRDTVLSGSCFNIPLVDVAPGEATGCWLAAREANVNVRQAPHAKVATKIQPGDAHVALGRDASGDWFFFRRGWVSETVIELSGACDRLPILDPAHVSSGTRSFCAAGYPGALPPRIDVGASNARVASYSLANRLREAPSLAAAQIGELPPRLELDAVLDGPACDGPFVWWQVRANGAVGWTVESDLNANVYYLEPLPRADISAGSGSHRAPSQDALPATFELISSANLDRLDTIAILPIEAPATLAWTRDETRLLALDASGILHAYNYPFFDLIWSESLAIAGGGIAFSDSGVLAINDGAGRIQLLSLQTDGVSSESTALGYTGALAAMAFSEDGSLLAAAIRMGESQIAGYGGRLLLWQLADETRLAWQFDFAYPATALAFSEDDRFLAVMGEGVEAGRAALWVYALESGELVYSSSLVASGAGVLKSLPADAPADFVYSSGDSLFLLDATAKATERFYHSPGLPARQLDIRSVVVPGAEVLLAVVDAGEASLTLFNALNADSPTLGLRTGADDLGFSPDGRTLALAQTDADRILILGAAAVDES